VQMTNKKLGKDDWQITSTKR